MGRVVPGALGLSAMTGGLVPPQAHSREKFKHVIIDPGHGGKDPGGRGYGLVEKELTLDTSFRLEKVLASKGIKVSLTRRDDTFIPLEDRAGMANASEGAIFVSIHYNSHVDRSISGTETFYFPGSNSSRQLATYIQSELGRRLTSRNRGSKPEILKVLEVTRGTAALVECGFISNRWESQRCGAEWFRQIIAEEIAQGIIRYRLP